jgi:hypothetical protein
MPTKQYGDNKRYQQPRKPKPIGDVNAPRKR